jgi:hypothetical protein
MSLPHLTQKMAIGLSFSTIYLRLWSRACAREDRRGRRFVPLNFGLWRGDPVALSWRPDKAAERGCG